ncbi:MAG: DUF4430 domain-containing protein [Candidatus Pacebacteria bacterium]|nr:DUF4430 domain-containing protein [Candidatus Paceibacterota bacterium]
MSTKKTASIAFIVVLSLIIITGGVYFLVQEIGSLPVKSLTEKPATNKDNQAKVSYWINSGTGEGKEYNLNVHSSSTVFSLLQDISAKENFLVDFQVYPDMGVFVKSIAGTANGESNKYWQYWVNDKLGEVAADKKFVKAGDKIEWKFDIAPNF